MIYLESIIFLAASAYLNSSFRASSLYLIRDNLRGTHVKLLPLPSSQLLRQQLTSELFRRTGTWWGCRSSPLWTWTVRWQVRSRLAVKDQDLYRSLSSPVANDWTIPGADQYLNNRQTNVNVINSLLQFDHLTGLIKMSCPYKGFIHAIHMQLVNDLLNLSEQPPTAGVYWLLNSSFTLHPQYQLTQSLILIFSYSKCRFSELTAVSYWIWFTGATWSKYWRSGPGSNVLSLSAEIIDIIWMRKKLWFSEWPPESVCNNVFRLNTE